MEGRGDKKPRGKNGRKIQEENEQNAVRGKWAEIAERKSGCYCCG
jgi:hypothetical protein